MDSLRIHVNKVMSKITPSGKERLPQFIRENYKIEELRHAVAILEQDFPEQYADICKVLTSFRLKKANVKADGKNKSPVATDLDGAFAKLGWKEISFDTAVVVDKVPRESPTHGVDCYKRTENGGIGIEIEWNNKDPFYDRDLNNFRLLFDLRVISVGVIVTRADELQDIFNHLDKGSSYGNSTTHLSKLIPRMAGGGGGGCPLLVFAITENLYDDKDDLAAVAKKRAAKVAKKKSIEDERAAMVLRAAQRIRKRQSRDLERATQNN